MSISVCNVTKSFGPSFKALDNISLEIPAGKLVALLGPSGSGKTTLLRIIAGLEFSDSGTVQFNGKDITDQTAQHRHVGFVFQHYALFRHLTVFENIAFGLRVRPRRSRPTEGQIRAKVGALLELIQLRNQARRYPSQLSGGQRQRVALARALAVEPRVLLLDEPFGALDAKVRQELRRWLRQLHEEIHITSVFVTHDQEEALELADLVAVVNEGRIEQVGSPEEVYHRPASSFVYNFLGNVNLFHGRVHNGRPYIDDRATENLVFVRPHMLEITRQPNGANHFRATTRHINAAGPLVKIEAVTDWGTTVHVEMSQEQFHSSGAGQGRDGFHHSQGRGDFPAVIVRSAAVDSARQDFGRGPRRGPGPCLLARLLRKNCGQLVACAAARALGCPVDVVAHHRECPLHRVSAHHAHVVKLHVAVGSASRYGETDVVPADGAGHWSLTARALQRAG